MVTVKIKQECLSKDRDSAWQLKKKIDEKVGALATGTQVLRCVVEPPPWKVGCLMVGGKCLSILNKRRLTKENLKPEWKVPFKIYWFENKESRPEMLASFDEASGWSVVGATVARALPGTAPEELHRDLSS